MIPESKSLKHERVSEPLQAGSARGLLHAALQHFLGLVMRGRNKAERHTMDYEPFSKSQLASRN